MAFSDLMKPDTPVSRAGRVILGFSPVCIFAYHSKDHIYYKASLGYVRFLTGTVMGLMELLKPDTLSVSSRYACKK